MAFKLFLLQGLCLAIVLIASEVATAKKSTAKDPAETTIPKNDRKKGPTDGGNIIGGGEDGGGDGGGIVGATVGGGGVEAGGVGKSGDHGGVKGGGCGRKGRGCGRIGYFAGPKGGKRECHGKCLYCCKGRCCDATDVQSHH